MGVLRSEAFPDAHHQRMRNNGQRRHYDHSRCLNAHRLLSVLLGLVLETQHEVARRGRIVPESFAPLVPTAAASTFC